jgi:hypothetical protein
MPIFNITGQDTLTIYDRIMNDFADGDISTFVFNNDRSTIKTGKNGNSIYADNEPGKNANVQLRLMAGSSDDVFLQGKLALSDQNFAATILARGTFVKNLGDGSGGLVRVVYTLAGGMITRYIDTKDNVEGDTQQGVALYNMVFAKATRSIE